MPALISWQRYQRGEATAAELEDVARDVLAELAESDSEASRAARDAGLDPADLVGARAEVREGAQGVEPVLTTIIVGILVNAGSTVAETLWKEVLWPRIRRRLGARALGESEALDEEA